MERFYRELGSGAPPAAALDATRRGILRDGGPAAHPSVWAAFVLVGDPGGSEPRRW